MEKKVVIFGAGRAGRYFAEEFRDKGIEVKYFIDNDSNKWDGYIDGIPIKAPDILKDLTLPVIIGSWRYEYEKEIREQLFAMGCLTQVYNKDEYFYSFLLHKPDDRDKVVEFKGISGPENVEISILLFGDNNLISQQRLDSIIELSKEYSCELVWYTGKNTSVRGKKVAFLRASDFVMKGWLSALLSIYQDNTIVGSQLLDYNGKILAAGQIAGKDGGIENYQKGASYMACEASYVRHVDAVPLSGMLLSYKNWEVWKESFSRGIGQVQFCLEMRNKGTDILYQPASVVLADKLEDNGTAPNQNDEVLMQEDSLEYINKGNFRGRMLMVDFTIPKYDTNAGARCVDCYLTIFKKLNMQIVFLPYDFQYSEGYAERYQQQGIWVLYGNEWRERYEEKLGAILGEFCFAFLNRPIESLKFIDLISKNRNIRISYFGHDIHYIRLERQYEVTGDAKYLEESRKMKSAEQLILSKVDYAGYPSLQEVRLLTNKFKLKNVSYYPLLYFQERSLTRRITETRDIMFVGGFRHHPNEDAVIWFVNEVYPLLLEGGYADKIFLIGSQPTEKVRNLENDKIIVTGYVDDLQLQGYYQECRISVAPLRFGAGMKGKLLEAMHEGIPIVTTSIGAEGIETVEAGICVADTAYDLAHEIMKLYNNTELLSQISEKEQNYINSNYGEQQLTEMFLNQIMGN